MNNSSYCIFCLKKENNVNIKSINIFNEILLSIHYGTFNENNLFTYYQIENIKQLTKINYFICMIKLTIFKLYF